MYFSLLTLAFFTTFLFHRFRSTKNPHVCVNSHKQAKRRVKKKSKTRQNQKRIREKKEGNGDKRVREGNEDDD